MSQENDGKARWYVVHTYSGYENKVAQNLLKIVENRRLQEWIHEVKIPTELVKVVRTEEPEEENDAELEDFDLDEFDEDAAVKKKKKKSKKKPKDEVERKLYPGYVFVKMVMTDDSWYIVRNTRGVTGFVGSTTKPIPLTDEEVFKLSGGANGAEKARVSVDYGVGDHIQIVDGSLKGCIGVVEEIDFASETVKAKVSMFGRETPAELSFTQIKLL